VTQTELNSAIVQQSIQQQLYDYKTLINVIICVILWVSLQTTPQYPTAPSVSRKLAVSHTLVKGVNKFLLGFPIFLDQSK